MAVINTNYKALFGQAALKGTERSLQTAMAQLSTGKRINSAKDDAAGMAIATRMTQQIRALNQSVRNAGDAVSLIQTVEGATNSITDMLQRMRELAIQAINDTNANDQRSYLDLEFQQLKKEIVRIADMTEWNGFPVLNGSAGERVGTKPVYKITSDGDFNGGLTITSAAPATASGDALVKSGGAWLMAGALKVVMSGSSVGSASFTLPDGQKLDITSAASVATNKLTLSKTTLETMGYKLIGGDVLIAFSAGASPSTALDDETILQTVSRTFLPLDELQANDLFINGETIDATAAADDLASYSNNAGSAIAKAAVINAKSAITGVSAVVNPNVMTGAAMEAGDPVTGSVVINGVRTTLVTTIEDNPRASRKLMVDAINEISARTGVRAIDTGYDNKGITLVAEDGRNIEVAFNSFDDAATFGERVGLKQGLQGGTYSLETSVEGQIVLRSSENGSIARSGLSTTTYFNEAGGDDYAIGDFSANVSTHITGERAIVDYAVDIKELTPSDLVINGVAIRSTTAEDDTKSDTDTLTSSRTASALAIATAINSHSGATGVTAIAGRASTAGTVTEVISSNTGTQYLYVNGERVEVEFAADDDEAARIKKVVSGINQIAGLYAYDTGKGVAIETEFGQNLSVWFDSSLATAKEFGLGAADNETAAGVSEYPGADDTYTGAATIYGKVILQSDKKFTVESGYDGFSDQSNFTALGFKEGTFGGEVDSAEGKMSPPRTGRLAFQVGASAGQIITIDLAAFGQRGPITGAIPGDVDRSTYIPPQVADETTALMAAGKQSLYINGVEVEVDFNNADPLDTNNYPDALDERKRRVMVAIHALTVEHGIRASWNEGETGLTLTPVDGSNFSVWYDSDKITSASEFGLGGIPKGVSGAPGATASYQGADVVYPETNNIRSAATATAVLSKLDKVMDRVNANRANMGAVMNRLQYAMDNLQNVSMNSAASRSQIEDADYAAASTELAKTQIMQQAATSVLAQANMSQQTVLKLLGG